MPPEYKENKIKLPEGGINNPTGALLALIAAIKGMSYFSRRACGIIVPPTAIAAAEAMPANAPKRVLANILHKANAPGMGAAAGRPRPRG